MHAARRQHSREQRRDDCREESELCIDQHRHEERGGSVGNREVPDSRIVERRLHACRHAVAKSKPHFHEGRLHEDGRADEGESPVFREAADSVFRELPGDPIDRDHHEEQSEEVMPRPPRVA